MMPLYKILPRTAYISGKCVFVGTQASTRPVTPNISPAMFDQTESVKAMEHVWNRNRSIVEGYQGVEPEISLAEARRVLSIATEYQAEGPSVQGIQVNYSVSNIENPQADSKQDECASFSPQDVHSPVHEGLSSHVGLYGCMQSNVPHPQSSNQLQGYGSYMNMPGNGSKLLDKYASANMQLYHPSRHLSTSLRAHSNVQSAEDIQMDDMLVAPSPQGIQGDNCVSFKLWMENCQRYHLPNCDEQIESIKAGRKTLAQVFMEQQEIIRQVAESYKKQQQSKLKNIANVQGLQDVSYNYDFSLSDPCPQGLQGEACANYKFWAYNCQAFGFGDCSEKSDAIKSGRRTLQDVFNEQDILIRKIVNDYKQKRSYSTQRSQPSGSTSEVGKSDAEQSESNISSTPSSPQNDYQDKNLSQKAKLKRAVKEYGGTVIVFHVGISLMSLGGFYVAVSSGLDVVGMLSKLGVGESILQSKLATGSTTFVVAYAVHKVFAPVRIAITLTCTPLIVRHLRKIGMLKPPKVN